jgi:hypothetical protein
VPYLLRAKADFGNKELEKLTELEGRVMEETETLSKEATLICTPLLK